MRKNTKQNGQQTNSSQSRNSRQARLRYQKRKRRNKRIRRIIFALILLLAIPIFISAKLLNQTTKAVTDKQVFVGLDHVPEDNIEITEYYVYGTHFNLEGSFTTNSVSSIQDMELVIRKEYQNSESVTTQEMNLISLTFEQNGNKIQFLTSDTINDGIDLEQLEVGSYCMLMKITYMDGTIAYKSLSNLTEEADIEYYTLTKENSNQKIQITFQEEEESSLSYLEVLVRNTELPDEIYDVVIDAGHGGTDTGAINGNYTEEEFTLAYAKKLKYSLEALGLKVLLTRDGTEDSDLEMAYTMYDEDGRVNVAGESGAKYCISLHLNSNEEVVSTGGVEVYCSNLCNTDFAELLADNIVTYADTSYSGMKSFQLTDGVYARTYTTTETQKAKETAIEQGYDPYSITTETDYYYMIRELGGIATNAYIDGRNTDYGSNEYYDSNSGVECYLIELGYMSIEEDLENIITNQSAYINAITASFHEIVE